jgi:hypothetical protein
VTSKGWADYFAEFPEDPWLAKGSHGWDQLIADFAACQKRAEAAEAALKRIREEVPKCFPNTWLDPLLSGKDAIEGLASPFTEKYTAVLKARVSAILEVK